MSDELTFKRVEDYILSMPNSRLDYPFGEGVAVYKTSVEGEEKCLPSCRRGENLFRLV